MAKNKHENLDSFEHFLQTTDVVFDLLLPNQIPQILCGVYLNPRYLRGSDFLMRFSQGRWAEDILVRTINATVDFRAVPYGPSSVAPSDPREMEHYFELEWSDTLLLRLLEARDPAKWASRKHQTVEGNMELRQIVLDDGEGEA